jgi:uncharacterized protein (DUF488 family)
LSISISRAVFTIGHSTHSAAEFVEMLLAYSIKIVVDVRKIPKSRHNPQFGEEELREYLLLQDIDYIHLGALGGLRGTTKASVNTAWRNLSFRGYADYMQTPGFEESLAQLINISAKQNTAIMCAEAVPWRCHRSLISDALLIRSIPVIDIMCETTSKPHLLSKLAEIDGDKITYPGTIAEHSASR